MKRAVGPAATAGLARTLRVKSIDQDITKFLNDQPADESKPFIKCKVDDCSNRSAI